MGTISLSQATGGFLGYQHFWVPTVRSNLFGSYLEITNPHAAQLLSSGADNARIWDIGFNTFWSPVKALDLGAEVVYTNLRLSGANSLSTADPVTGKSTGYFTHRQQQRLARPHSRPDDLLINANERFVSSKIAPSQKLGVFSLFRFFVPVYFGHLTIRSGQSSTGISSSLALRRPRTETPASWTVSSDPETSGCLPGQIAPRGHNPISTGHGQTKDKERTASGVSFTQSRTRRRRRG